METRTPEEKEAAKRDRRLMILIRLGLLAGGVALLLPPWKDWFEHRIGREWGESASGLIRGIGEAGLVALVLEILVDARLKRRLVQETIRDVAPRILAHLLPEKIFRYIEEELLRANLVRRSW